MMKRVCLCLLAMVGIAATFYAAIWLTGQILMTLSLFLAISECTHPTSKPVLAFMRWAALVESYAVGGVLFLIVGAPFLELARRVCSEEVGE